MPATTEDPAHKAAARAGLAAFVANFSIADCPYAPKQKELRAAWLAGYRSNLTSGAWHFVVLRKNVALRDPLGDLHVTVSRAHPSLEILAKDSKKLWGDDLSVSRWVSMGHAVWLLGRLRLLVARPKARDMQ